MRVGVNGRVRLVVADVAAFTEPVRDVGFWRSEQEPWFPDPREHIDESWSGPERDAVITHVEHRGERAALYAGLASCRLCGAALGCADLTDGVYYWPEGLDHYLREHHVKLPQEFVMHVLRDTPDSERSTRPRIEVE
jgi:hypothetical protein